MSKVKEITGAEFNAFIKAPQAKDEIAIVDFSSKKGWVAECEQCGQHYPNWAGSTPCCGSIAFIIDSKGNKGGIPVFGVIK